MKILVTGGASSGKSAYAENAALCFPLPRYYLATMHPYDDEGRARVLRHRRLREGKGFSTIECYTFLDNITLTSSLPIDLPPEATSAVHFPLPNKHLALDEQPLAQPQGTVLLECLANLVANTLFDQETGMQDADEVFMRLLHGIAHIDAQCANLIVITNDVGSDGTRYPEGTRTYQELLGRLSCAVAAASDAVVECISGIPQTVKGTPLLSSYPQVVS